MTSIDISIEEFRRRKSQKSTTPREKRKRCPACESVNLIRKAGGPGGSPRKHTASYQCGYCGHHFNRPVPPERTEQ